MPQPGTRNDAHLWAAFADEIHKATRESVWEAQVVARRLVAAVRREAMPGRPSWALGDPSPEVFPAAVFDVDGAVWELVDPTGRYRMSAVDWRLLVEGAPARELPWEALLYSEGPVTVHSVRGGGATGVADVRPCTDTGTGIDRN